MALRSPDEGGKLSGDLHRVHSNLPCCSLNHWIREAGGKPQPARNDGAKSSAALRPYQGLAMTVRRSSVLFGSASTDPRIPAMVWHLLPQKPCQTTKGVLQLLVPKRQMIPAVAEVFLWCFRKREGFTTRLTDTEQTVTPFGTSICPFPRSMPGSHFKFSPVAGRRSEDLEKPPRRCDSRDEGLFSTVIGTEALDWN